MVRPARGIWLLLAVTLAACDGGPSTDIGSSGSADTTPDAEAPDAEAPDADEPDAGEPDADELDADVPDADDPDAAPVTCMSCHGSDGEAAPPTDTAGHEDTTWPGVGAHRTHLGPSAVFRAGECQDCHVVPVEVSDPGHVDPGPAELTWGSVATADGVVAAYDGTSCAVYCHGVTLPGGALTEPEWTGKQQVFCGSCHGAPPPAPHPQVLPSGCSGCHPFTGYMPNDPSTHVDGTLQVSTACGTCHELPPPTGTHLLHAGLAAPIYGGLGTAADLPAPAGYAFGCGHCHPLAAASHMNGGVAEIELFDAAAPPGSSKTRSPTASYTPGPDALTDSFGLSYTLGTCIDAACHGGMTTTSGPVPEPGVDFPSSGYPIQYPPYTVDRHVAYQPATWGGALGCGGCHGFPPRAVYPADEAAAGESHSFIDSWGYEDMHMWNHGYDPLACRTCHAATVATVGAFTRDAMGIVTLSDLPVSGFDKHANGVFDVVFQAQPVLYSSPMDLAGASWDPAARTCADVACHFSQTEVAFGAPFRFDNGVECNSCHQF